MIMSKNSYLYGMFSFLILLSLYLILHIVLIVGFSCQYKTCPIMIHTRRELFNSESNSQDGQFLAAFENIVL